MPRLIRSEQVGEIVGTYTSCMLTEPGDKLIAISGIANAIEQKLNDEYLAGLFRRYLPSQLLWYIEADEQRHERPCLGPTAYRALSWSWASVDGVIRYGDFTDRGVIIELLDAFVTSKLEPGSRRQLVEGSIHLRGRLCHSEAYEQEANRYRMNVRDLNDYAETFMDISGDKLEGLYAHLPVICYVDYDFVMIEGLLLRHVEGMRNTYRRFGMFVLSWMIEWPTEPKSLGNKECREFMRENYEYVTPIEFFII